MQVLGGGVPERHRPGERDAAPLSRHGEPTGEAIVAAGKTTATCGGGWKLLEAVVKVSGAEENLLTGDEKERSGVKALTGLQTAVAPGQISLIPP